MEEIKKYTQELTEKARAYLSKEYNLAELKVSDFQAINFFLMDKAINKGENLFIDSFDNDLPALSQFPAILSVAISLFYKNYCDNHTIYEVGDILQKDRRRYKIIQVNTDYYTVLGGKKGEEFRARIRNTDIHKYKITTGQRTGRRVKVGFKQYTEFYERIFNEKKNLPSQFKYKAAIIMSKKEFEEELKTQNYIDIELNKAIPMCWIARSGSKGWNHIPIEPMIYCVPDYDTLQTYILDKGINIETLVVIGKNRYKNEVSTKIRLALRNEDIPNCIILGSEGFNDEQNQFLKWQWTYPEFQYLEKKAPTDIEIIGVTDEIFQEKISDFINYLNLLEKENGLSLINVKRLRRFLYALVMAKNDNSRNLTQVEFLQHLIQKVASETIEQEFYDLEIDDSEVQQQISSKVNEIFTNFSNVKLKVLQSINPQHDYLIVPTRLIENWKDEFSSKTQNICSLKNFYKKQNTLKGSKKVYVLSIYNNGMFYDQVLDIAINSPHSFIFLSYPEEIQVVNKHLQNHQNSLIQEYQSKDRRRLTGIEFKKELHKNVENLSLEEIMDGFYRRNEHLEKRYDYESNKQVNYQFCFEGQSEPLVYDGSKTVLIDKNGRWVKSKAYNLLPGDSVRIYSNLSKERLFEIASKEDNNNRFQEIENMSRLWKKALLTYFTNRVVQNLFYDKDDLLQSLKDKGSGITNSFTIGKWLNEKDKEKFPHSNNDLKAIKTLINDEKLNDSYAEMLRIKGFYRGLMISLGRDLSDDVMDFIVSDGKIKGRMLSKFETEEINSFIKSAAPIRTVVSKEITEDEESN